MAFIGNQPAESFTSFATQEFSTSATTSYTLNHAVTNENEIALFVNNVRQQPGSGKAYTATGTALTLSAATASTDTMYCVFLGRALQTVTPATNSVTSSMLGSTFFTGATDVGADLADADLLLIDDGAGGTLRKTAMSRVKTYVGGGITEADQYRLTADLNSDAQPISANWERNDSTGFGKIGTGVTQSSGYFSFASTGVYFINFGTTGEVNGDSLALSLYTTTDNSSYSIVAVINLGDGGNYPISSSKDFIFNVTNTTTHKCYLRASSMAGNNNTRLFGASDSNYTQITFIRLGDSV